MHVPEPVISVAIKPSRQRVRDQHVQGAAPLHQGGPDLPGRRRSGVRRDDHPRHGRAAPRGLRRAHEARVPGRGGDRRRRRSPTARPSRRGPSSTTLHKKQTGGSGQYGQGRRLRRAVPEAEFEFVDEIKGGVIPREFMPAVEKGFKSMSRQGAPDRLPGRERTRRGQRRRLARGRLVRHRLPGGRPRRLARGLRPGQAEDPRADHARRGRGARPSSPARSWARSCSAAA